MDQDVLVATRSLSTGQSRALVAGLEPEWSRAMKARKPAEAPHGARWRPPCHRSPSGKAHALGVDGGSEICVDPDHVLHLLQAHFFLLTWGGGQHPSRPTSDCLKIRQKLPAGLSTRSIPGPIRQVTVRCSSGAGASLPGPDFDSGGPAQPDQVTSGGPVRTPGFTSRLCRRQPGIPLVSTQFGDLLHLGTKGHEKKNMN